jgi:hypothetical protein
VISCQSKVILQLVPPKSMMILETVDLAEMLKKEEMNHRMAS